MPLCPMVLPWLRGSVWSYSPLAFCAVARAPVLILGGTCGGAALSTWSLYAMGASSCPSAGPLPPSLPSFALTLPLAFLAKGLSHFIRTMPVPSWHIRTCLTALPMSFYCRRPAFRRTTFARPVFRPMKRTASLPRAAKSSILVRSSSLCWWVGSSEEAPDTP